MFKPRFLSAAALVTGAAVAGWWLFSDRSAVQHGAGRSVDVAELLGAVGDSAGYARALQPRQFDFPRDHGAHPDFRNEWWYFTGNLRAADGRRFGYQFTVFRSALSPQPRGGASSWGTRQAYMGHLALSDPGTGSFHYFERFSRGGAGLAGAGDERLSVWIEDWSVRAGDDGRWHAHAQAGEGADAIGLDLVLEPIKPVVLQGNGGLSRKGDEAGNASYYYSLTRIATRGTVTTAQGIWPVRGTSWMDREWSTSVLAPDQVGWDWFSIQLDRGEDLMFYRLRRKDGGVGAHSQGVWVRADGTIRRLEAAEVYIDALAQWTSPRGGSYPSRWRLRVPALALDLDVRPVAADQELDVIVRYWEGAVDVVGLRGGEPARGWGYVELTGYSGAAPPR